MRVLGFELVRNDKSFLPSECPDAEFGDDSLGFGIVRKAKVPEFKSVLQTTDENWNETIHKEFVKVFYKLVSLNNLAVYWNSKSKLISDMTDHDAILKAMNDAIVVGNRKPEGYNYSKYSCNPTFKVCVYMQFRDEIHSRGPFCIPLRIFRCIHCHIQHVLNPSAVFLMLTIST